MNTPILATDLFNYSFFNKLLSSPNGSQLAYTISIFDEKLNSYKNKIHFYHLDSGKHSALVSRKKFDSYIWENEDTLLLTSSKPNRETLCSYYNLNSKETTEAFTLPLQANSIKKISDGLYLVHAEVNTNYKDAEEEKANEDYIPITELPFWDNGAGYVSGIRNTLFLYSVEEKTCMQITPKMMSTGSYAVIGQNIYFCGEEYDRQLSSLNGLFSFSMETAETTTIVPQELMRIGKLQVVGEELFVLGSLEAQTNHMAKSHWYALKGDTLAKVFVHEETVGCNVSSDCRYGRNESVAAFGDKLLYLSTHHTTCDLNTLTLDGDHARLPEFKGVVDGVAVCGDKIIFSAMKKGKLEELYLTDGSSYKQITRVNGRALKDKYVGKPEYIGFTNSDGIKIDGWAIKPINFVAGEKYPMLLSMHGGPCVAWGDIFVHEMQMLAGQGYMVIFCNPRGSDGKGEAFADIRGQYGGVDFQDFMEFCDHAIKKYPEIDTTKLGVLGGSYGGFMTNWIIGHTDRFAAAVSQRSFCNIISDFGNSCIGFSFDVDQFGGTPWTELEKIWDHSPLKYVPQVVTPTLFIHSIEDYNCPLSQGFEMFAGLKYHGVTTEMMLFKGENHELSRSGKPLHRVRRLNEISRWMEKFLK